MVIWHTKLGKSAAKTAELAGCSKCTVQEVLWLHRESGNIRKTFVQPHSSPQSLNHGDIIYISFLLNANPTVYLDELQIRLAEM